MGGRNVLNECSFDPAIPYLVIFSKTIIARAYSDLKARISISALFVVVKNGYFFTTDYKY